MPFQPGQSGNPAGRPRGARNKTTILAEALLERDGEPLTSRFINEAETGNFKALAFLMGIIFPKRDGALVEVDLPPLQEASDAPAAIAAVFAAVSTGELTPQEGLSLTRMVEAFLRIKQKVEKLARKPERAIAFAAEEVRKAAEPHVSCEGEASPSGPAMIQADAPKQPAESAGESGVHPPASQALQALFKGMAGGGLSRLRQGALSNTSVLAQSAPGRARIVSPLLIPRGSPAACGETRAAA
jgi:hypothetical protein